MHYCTMENKKLELELLQMEADGTFKVCEAYTPLWTNASGLGKSHGRRKGICNAFLLAVLNNNMHNTSVVNARC